MGILYACWTYPSNRSFARYFGFIEPRNCASISMNLPRESTHVEIAVGMVEDATSEIAEPTLNYSTRLRVGFGSYETRHEELPARRTYTGRSRPDPAICDTCTSLVAQMDSWHLNNTRCGPCRLSCCLYRCLDIAFTTAPIPLGLKLFIGSRGKTNSVLEGQDSHDEG